MAGLPSGWAPASDTLADRTVLVTGAAGGLGRASALACARAGASVVLLGRKVPALEKLYDEIEGLGASAPSIYPMDLSGAQPHDYAALAEALDRQCGGVHGIVHAAAQFAGLTPLEQLAPEDWSQALAVNLTAPFLLTQACLPLLREQADASIVFVLEDETRIAKAFWGAYGVAKRGVHGLADILHQETENSSVRVNLLQPPPMRTTLRRMAYFGEDTLQQPLPEQFAPAVVYLLAQEGRAARGQTLDLRT
jgi:NAD(P)-dependent dehydrogenase (short-subunit alcohol dehydrogenase family)